jgi:S-formylglutathione hydrolase FrmB
MSAGITRRGVLAGAVALPWLVACGADTDRTALDTPAALDLEDGAFSSRFWPGRPVRWRLARPHRADAGAAPQPLVVAMHGQGGTADEPFADVQIEHHVVSTGLAVAAVDGGDFYWHARRSGIDTSRMVIEDLLPLLSRKGLATDRIGLIGWSMGGYGALLMATKLGPGRVAGVVAVTPALWLEQPGGMFAGAFDDREDFARNDVFAKRSRLRGIPLRLDCGQDDFFIEANRAFVRELPDAAVTFDDGTHTAEYWKAHAGVDMSWLREQFARPPGACCPETTESAP